MPDKTSYTDKELFLLISEGDQDAFRDLFERYDVKLYPYVVEVLKSPEAADDIIQDSFMRIWLNREKLTTIDNPPSWIFKLVLNACYNILRRQITENKVLGIVAAEKSPRDQYAEQDIQYAQTKRLIGEAVAQLTPQRRKIYSLNRIDGLKVNQIANELDLSVSTVKNTLAAALVSIRDYLKANGIVYSFLAGLFLFYK